MMPTGTGCVSKSGKCQMVDSVIRVIAATIVFTNPITISQQEKRITIIVKAAVRQQAQVTLKRKITSVQEQVVVQPMSIQRWILVEPVNTAPTMIPRAILIVPQPFAKATLMLNMIAMVQLVEQML